MMKVSSLKEGEWVKVGEQPYQVAHVNPRYARLHPRGASHSISIILANGNENHFELLKTLRRK